MALTIAAIQRPGPFRFTFAGERFEFPPAPDVKVLAHLQQHEVAETLESMFGTEQYARFLATNAPFMPEDLTALLNGYRAHIERHAPRLGRAARRRPKRRK